MNVIQGNKVPHKHTTKRIKNFKNFLSSDKINQYVTGNQIKAQFITLFSEVSAHI